MSSPILSPFLTLLFLIILSPVGLLAQSQSEDIHADSSRFWVVPGTDLQGDSVVYRQFNRHSKCDDCSEQIKLPFRFDFYGEEYQTVYLNANGNLTFGEASSEYTPSDFCLLGPKMIAPFYADVDLNQCGEIIYYVDEHSLIVTWLNVCHYLANGTPTGLQNTFQLILTDGHYTHIRTHALPQRASVLFNYRDMQWTTGHSSGGVEGLGGQPATVGVNQGDGLKCFAYGTFDHEGSDYVAEIASGVSHLDERYVAWNAHDGLPAEQSFSEITPSPNAPLHPELELNTYPNPFDSKLYVDLKNEEEQEVLLQITDLSGKTVYHKKRLVPARASAMEIDTEQMSGGLYYLSVHTEGAVLHAQIAKP
ncbi:MAG: nidogen-like domain-containing protein [Bacteroidota bacterium]